MMIAERAGDGQMGDNDENRSLFPVVSWNCVGDGDDEVSLGGGL